MKNGFLKPKNNPPDSYRGRLGHRGEEVAVAFFRSKGFLVVARNWRCRFGEIDLIVEKEGYIRFVEVKMRRSHAFGYPETSVTPKKLRHLQAAIDLWLRSASMEVRSYQADVLAISWLKGVDSPQIVWIEGV